VPLALLLATLFLLLQLLLLPQLRAADGVWPAKLLFAAAGPVMLGRGRRGMLLLLLLLGMLTAMLLLLLLAPWI
jgi:hypothetical protein